jgi:hypothetical protein
MDEEVTKAAVYLALVESHLAQADYLRGRLESRRTVLGADATEVLWATLFAHQAAAEKLLHSATGKEPPYRLPVPFPHPNRELGGGTVAHHPV